MNTKTVNIKNRVTYKSGEPHDNDGSQEQPKNGWFVIQKHDARQLHFDFRLAIEGGLSGRTMRAIESEEESDD